MNRIYPPLLQHPFPKPLGLSPPPGPPPAGAPDDPAPHQGLPSPFPPPCRADNCHLHAEPAAPRAGPGRAAPPGVWEERGQLPGEEGARAPPEEATGTPFTTSRCQATPPSPAHAPAPAHSGLGKSAFRSPQPAALNHRKRRGSEILGAGRYPRYQHCLPLQKSGRLVSSTCLIPG